MLQRLPALGRLKAESNDRQLIDTYILDGLRANDVGQLITSSATDAANVLNTSYVNTLNELGLRLLARDVVEHSKQSIHLIAKSIASKNRVIGCDIISAFMYTELSTVDFEGMRMCDGLFGRFDMSRVTVTSLTIEDSFFAALILPSSVPPNTNIRNCLAEIVIGISAPTALPAWIEKLDSDRFDSVDSVSRIRRIGLQPSHEILVTIIRKTFFQKGAGRKEEALLRGMDQLASKKVAREIVNLLIKERILSTGKGSEGTIYVPNRKFAGRMKQMLYELKTSQDPVWAKIGLIN